jgi:hypothetical protein
MPSNSTNLQHTVLNTICSSIQLLLLKMGIYEPETCRNIYDNKSQFLIKLVHLNIFIYDAPSHKHQVWEGITNHRA